MTLQMNKSIFWVGFYPGKISVEVARSFAESEFEKLHIVQNHLPESDFDKVVLSRLTL